MSMVQYCFTSTETVGRKAQDGHLDFHTAPELCPPPFPSLISILASVDVMQNVYGLGGAVDIQSRVDSKHDISMTDSR